VTDHAHRGCRRPLRSPDFNDQLSFGFKGNMSAVGAAHPGQRMQEAKKAPAAEGICALDCLSLRLRHRWPKSPWTLTGGSSGGGDLFRLRGTGTCCGVGESVTGQPFSDHGQSWTGKWVDATAPEQARAHPVPTRPSRRLRLGPHKSEQQPSTLTGNIPPAASTTGRTLEVVIHDHHAATSVGQVNANQRQFAANGPTGRRPARLGGPCAVARRGDVRPTAGTRHGVFYYSSARTPLHYRCAPGWTKPTHPGAAPSAPRWSTPSSERRLLEIVTP